MIKIILRHHVTAFLVGVVVPVFFSLFLHGQSLEDFYIDGKLNANVAAFPILLFSAHTLHPWASIIILDMNNSKPESSNDFDANLERSRANTSGTIPRTLS